MMAAIASIFSAVFFSIAHEFEQNRASITQSSVNIDLEL